MLKLVAALAVVLPGAAMVQGEPARSDASQIFTLEQAVTAASLHTPAADIARQR